MQNKSIDISVEARLSIQLFEQNILPFLTREEILSQLIGVSYQYYSYRQSMAKPKATALGGDYLQEHLDIVDNASFIPDKEAKNLLIQYKYLLIGIKTADEVLREGLGID